MEIMSKKFTVIVLFLLMTKRTAQLLHCSSFNNNLRTQFLLPGQNITENEITNESYPINSTRRIFTTDPGYNITLVINVKQTFLLPESDCANGGPFVKVTTYPDQVNAKTKHLCNKRSADLNHPVISSNRIMVDHCNFSAGSRLQYSVDARLAGFVSVSTEEDVYFVTSNKNEEWISLKSVEQNERYFMFVEISDLNVRISDKGFCKRGYLKIEDKNKRMLENVCNRNTTYKKRISRYLNHTFINITFKRSSFTLKTRLVTSFEENNTPLEQIGIIMSTLSPTTNRNSEPYINGKSPQESNLFLYIGLGLFVVAFTVCCIVLLYCVKRHCCSNQGQENKVHVPETSIYRGIKSDDVQMQRKDGHSLNNAMYGTIVTGGKNESAIFANRPPPQPVKINNGQADLNEKAEKRKLRLSQLNFDKYIDVDLSMKNEQKKQQKAAKIHEKSNYARPPLPPPLNLKQQNNEIRKYESIDSPLSDKDLVPPAYCSLETETHSLLSRPSQESSNIDRRPNKKKDWRKVCEGLESNEQPNQVEQACFSSFDSFTDDETIEDNEDASPDVSNPTIGKDGYLSASFLSQEDTIQDSPQIAYVYPNKASNESLEKHFQKPIPKAAVILSIKSKLTRDKDDNRCADTRNDTYSDVPTENPQVFKKSSPLLSFQSQDQYPSHHSYKNPRPSVPDIFIKSAYTTGKDLRKIRSRLELATHEEQKLRSVESDSKILDMEKRFHIYDSPMLSSTNSKVSSTNSPGYSYDTPRPSLPHIFQGNEL